MARTLKEEKGRQVTWSEVLIHATLDDRYWDREVRRPAIGFFARGTKRSFSDFETNSLAVPSSGGPRRRRGNQCRIWPTSEPAPEHGTRRSTGKAVAKEARGSIPSRTNMDCSSPPGTAPRSASALPSAQTATHARHRARKVVRMCVRDACSLTETTQRHARGGEQIDYVPRPHRHRLQVRQTVCLRLRALWKWSWFTQAVADITGRKLFNHLADDVADATSSKLVEIVRQERVLWVHAAPPHVLSGEATKRVSLWLVSLCVFL